MIALERKHRISLMRDQEAKRASGPPTFQECPSPRQSIAQAIVSSESSAEGSSQPLNGEGLHSGQCHKAD